jgi:hypothetical protein
MMMVLLLALLFRILFKMLFRMLVTLTEHYWITLGERRRFTFSKAQTAWRGRASVKPSPLALELQHLPTNIVAIPPVLRITAVSDLASASHP